MMQLVAQSGTETFFRRAISVMRFLLRPARNFLSPEMHFRQMS